MSFILMVYIILFLYTLLSILTMIAVLYYKKYIQHKSIRLRKIENKWKHAIELVLSDESTKPHLLIKRQLKQLRSTEHLMGLLAASQEYLISDNQTTGNKFKAMVEENKISWITLGKVYNDKPLLPKAYFAYFCEQLCVNKPEEYNEMTRLMLDYTLAPSMYCRENALNALIAFGNEKAVVEAFIELSRQNIPHKPKLITDGLLKFKGDSNQLIDVLYKNIQHFSLDYQIGVIDYFRFSGEHLKYKLKYMLESPNTDLEIICAVLRFYRKYPVMEFKPLMLSWLTPKREIGWECISTAASTLGQYPGSDTVSALLNALRSKNWHIRRNAAISLSELDVKNDMLQEVLEGDDRFAKDQLVYHLAKKEVMG